MRKRMNHDAGFKARVGLEALKGERTVSELAAEYGVYPTMISQWKKSLLDGAADIFERGGKTAPSVDEDTVRTLHAKIGELAVAMILRRAYAAPPGPRSLVRCHESSSPGPAGEAWHD